jgi:Cu+-exporting ATPase
MMSQSVINKKTQVQCYHCGESCKAATIHFDDKDFCCEGCKLVYDLLKENSLCTYYNLNSKPGISPEKRALASVFDYLDNEQVSSKLISFTDGITTTITFFVPKIHCSSCIWLIENLHKLNGAIISSTVNFLRKEVTVVFNSKQIKLAQVATLLANIGYEPLINLNDLEQKPVGKNNRTQIIKIGLAGFCFGNSMMLSFPEYFSWGNFHDQAALSRFFGYLNLFLALPVFFYCASDFFLSAWKSIRYRYLNIDTPIALAILVTFLRSVYEITTHTGAGYMDSMTGIVFFMLIGRYFQNKTYETLSFERDYKSYFPIGVTVKDVGGKEKNCPVFELKKGDRIIIRNNEIIPSDALLISEFTHIDYSFITGESAAVKKKSGELIYAGAKQLEGAIELEVQNSVSHSYLTQLWNKENLRQEKKQTSSYIDKINKLFSIIVLTIAFSSVLYWLFNDPAKALNAFTAVLIVACPCGLLLTSTFANGNILRILGRNKFYLKNAAIIEKLTQIDTIVFDKTGTITHGSSVDFVGPQLSEHTLQLVASLASQSSHPLSKKIASLYAGIEMTAVTEFKEFPGKGVVGSVDGKRIILGSEFFVTGTRTNGNHFSTKVFLMVDGRAIGYFNFTNAYRSGLKDIVNKLSGNYRLNLLSGDNNSEKENIQAMFGKEAELLFDQKPEEKMYYIHQLQLKGQKVVMVGDGLNDAGALKQSDVGIVVSDAANNFSPACDAILDGSQFFKLPDFIAFARAGKMVIIATFLVSLIYNVVGVSFAVQGTLSPVIAAVLMPASSISIVLISTLSITFVALRKKL